jgi:hypothetical protein
VGISGLSRRSGLWLVTTICTESLASRNAPRITAVLPDGAQLPVRRFR